MHKAGADFKLVKSSLYSGSHVANQASVVVISSSCRQANSICTHDGYRKLSKLCRLRYYNTSRKKKGYKHQEP